ncbi:MAG: hypothetical protein AABZ47_17415 [Planctomycetota bacterium]
MAAIAVVEKGEKDSSRTIVEGRNAPVRGSRMPLGKRNVVRWPVTTACVLLAVGACALGGWIRWRLVSETKWQGDEIPLMVRSTGLCGQVSNELEAKKFVPTRHSLFFGALRALKPPKYRSAVHTTTNFWTNLAVHVGGCSPTVGRIPILIWSVLGLVFAGCAAWMISRDMAAVCLGVLFLALSPFAISYSAQARGYSEAMAAAPLFLIALEWLRREPTSWARAGLVLCSAIHLACTVYTMWIFWVLPVLLFALAALPSTSDTTSGWRSMRAVLCVVLLGAIFAVGIYTLDRFNDLVFSGTHMGVAVRDWESANSFVWKIAATFFVAPAVMLLPLFLGIVATWRSELRWWVGAAILSLLTIIGFTAINGSPGYDRNLGYLVPLGAILMGVGVCQLLRTLARGLGARLVGALSLGGGSLGLVLGFPLLQVKATAQMPPDWGGAVTEIQAQPLHHGPRWISPCLVNHWQVDWYQSESWVEELLRIPPGETIELVHVNPLNGDGRSAIFRIADTEDTFVEGELPSFLAQAPASIEFRGVEVRRWKGVRVSEIPSDRDHSGSLLLLLVQLDDRTKIFDAKQRFEIQRRSQAHGAVSFHLTSVQNGDVWPLLFSVESQSNIQGLLESLEVNANALHWFSLSTIE